MRVLKVSITENKHIRFLFFDGTRHSVSPSEWRNGMKSIYYERHKVLLMRRENSLSDRIVFSQSI